MRRVPDYRKTDFEGLKRYLLVIDWQRRGREGQVRFRMDEVERRLEREWCKVRGNGQRIERVLSGQVMLR